MMAAFEMSAVALSAIFRTAPVERIILPDSTILIDYMLCENDRRVADMRVFLNA